MSNGTARVTLRRGCAVAAVFVLLYAVVLVLRPLPDAHVVAVDNLGQLLAATAAAVCCALVALRSAQARTRAAWALLAAATGAWAAGQAVWSWYELVADREVPFPSLADAGYLAFPVLAAAGLLVLPVGREDNSGRLRDLLDGFVAAGSLLLLSWASSLGAAASGGGSTDLETALGVAYPLSDVALLTLVLLVLSRAASTGWTVLVPLAAGLAALAIADSTFLYLTATGSYASGDLCGIGWTGGFALIAVAALAARGHEPRTGPADDPVEQPARTGTRTQRLRLALPYLPLLPAQAVVTLQLLTGDRRAPAFEVALALLLMTGVLGRQFSVMTENRALLLALSVERETARHASLHDPLTGLANRNLFADRVAHALERQTREPVVTTVMYCDLDDFKTVNDGLGHAAGDALLLAVAARLRECVRPTDTVARLGGDEFAVLVQNGPQAASTQPEHLAARLVSSLAAPAAVLGEVVTVSVSVGLASASQDLDAAIGGAELLRRADVAMYAAKRSGKATWVSYDSALHTPPASIAPGPVPGMREPAPVRARTG